MTKDISLKVVRYENRYKNDWDKFVDEAKNSTFLFCRDFMEYHKDRFEDFSLMIFEKDVLKAVLPANKAENILYSHQGLTYGGLVVNEKICKNDYFQFYKALEFFLKQNYFSYFILKQQNAVYSRNIFNWENEYFKDVLKKEMNLTADLLNLNISKSKLKHYRKSKKNGFEIKKETNLKPFWKNVLEPLLRERYQTKPVHTLEEIQYLSDLFPENIQQYSVYHNNEIIAGITLFICNNVIKSQYGAATDL